MLGSRAGQGLRRVFEEAFITAALDMHWQVYVSRSQSSSFPRSLVLMRSITMPGSSLMALRGGFQKDVFQGKMFFSIGWNCSPIFHAVLKAGWCRSAYQGEG